MIKLNQPIESYYLRFFTYLSGDMQQVLEERAIVTYRVRIIPKPSAGLRVMADSIP